MARRRLVQRSEGRLGRFENDETRRHGYLPKNPQEVLIRPDGKVAYVSCDASKKVAAMDVKTFKVEKLMTPAAGPTGWPGRYGRKRRSW